MGIFARANDILSANLNDLLDRCEDPEKMIKLLIQEMDEHVERAHEALAKALAGEKRLDAEVKKNRAAAAEWQAKAEASIGRGDERLARECLLRKKEHEGAAATLEEQWEVARKTGEALKADYQRLQRKADEARRRRDTLVARQMAAEAQKQMATLGPSMSRAQRSFSKFDQMERKIEAMESEAQALAELSRPDDDLDGQLARLEREASVDAELEALKAQIEKKA
jgi:phage shock protein A